MMRVLTRLLLAPLFVVGAAACGDDEPVIAVDDALRSDLQMAAQMQPYPPQFTSPYEMGYAPSAGYPQRYQPVSYGGYAAPAPVARAPRPVVQRAPSPAPAQVERHTKRDAAIGAVAGAAIGAATSRDKVKGAIIGAVLGGVVGGVIGHTVDVEPRY